MPGEVKDREPGQGAGDLAAAVRDLADRIRRQDRLLNLNSFAAYLLFTLLLGTCFYFLYSGRTGAADAERDAALAARDAAQERAEVAARRLAARDAADRASAELLELLRQRRQRDAIAAHGKLADLDLTQAQRQFLTDAVNRARAELAAEAAVRARLSFDRRDVERARDAARDGLALAAEAGPALAPAHASELRYLLAASLDKLGQPAEARAAYTAFLAAAPAHPLAPRARQRLARLPR